MWRVAFTVLAMTAPTPLPKGKTARPAIVPAACTARLERARDELIDRGFAPTADKDTRRWLRIDQFGSGVMLQLEMRSSADGPATFYSLKVQHPRTGIEPMRWHLLRGKYCCGEHAAKEDRLFQHRWVRQSAPLVAEIAVVEFEAVMNDPASKQSRDLFVDVARRAADDCLAARRP
jgi:hypothetical protein